MQFKLYVHIYKKKTFNNYYYNLNVAPIFMPINLTISPFNRVLRYKFWVDNKKKNWFRQKFVTIEEPDPNAKKRTNKRNRKKTNKVGMSMLFVVNV